MKRIVPLVLVAVLATGNYAKAADSASSMFEEASKQDCSSVFQDMKDAFNEDSSKPFKIIANDDPVQVEKSGNNMICRVGLTVDSGKDLTVLLLSYYHRNTYLTRQVVDSQSSLKEFKGILKQAAVDEKNAMEKAASSKKP